ncbi:MAG: hypothetical protein Kow00121_07810 [Elainellaceae cyanobacterium]
MVDNDNLKDRYFYPHASYHGHFTPEALAFNANLQEFTQRISIICNLETAGKIPPEEAYKRIKSLWKQLKQSKSELLDAPEPPKPDLPPDE